MKRGSLQDLGALRDELERRARTAREAHALECAAHEAAERERTQFARAVGEVTPLAPHGRARLQATPPAPLPLQTARDEQAALRESISDDLDFESLLLTDDGLSFRRAGVGHDVLARLRRGHWAIQAEIDLHGMTREHAREALGAFVRDSARRGLRCLRVVHGKGNGSPGRQPVLKSKVQRWLSQTIEVIAFAQASGPQGGAGALIVLLDSRASSAGRP
jgi:DNA-nicking Smr family endonuclease